MGHIIPVPSLLAATFLILAFVAFGAFADPLDMARIPAGPFLMGSISEPEDERPQYKVAAFVIDRTKETDGQLGVFLNAFGAIGPNDGREESTRRQVHGTRGRAQDSWHDELATTHRGRDLLPSPRGAMITSAFAVRGK